MSATIDDFDRAWWKEAVVYQVYPQSFNDTDGDGVGDIRGIIERLDYLDDLGVDVVWVNPLYDSPHVDDGYDIRDYRSLRAEYGTMDDFQELLDKMHDRGMRLVMDLVVNHTSDQHAWFQQSRKRDEEYADYYWWRDGDPEGDPPNNWESAFSGSAWTWDEEREQYYLHLFDEKQPDLNWENEAVREAVYDMITWWLEQGIDGFRMDVFNLLSKADGLPDGDPDGAWVGREHFANGPRIHDYISEMVDRTFSNYDVMTVGEAVNATTEDAKRYCGPSGDGLNMIFHYEHMRIDFGEEHGWWEIGDWTIDELREVVSNWQHKLADSEAWNALFLGSHDFPRIVSRWGDDGEYRRESAKLLATLLFTLRGTPYVFQGDEIGMTNYPWQALAELRDADARNRVENKIAAGDIEGFDDAQDVVQYRARDNARTPVQWSGDEPNAGFTEGDPWISVNPNFRDVNVEDARENPDSIWHYYRDLIALRHDSDLLVYGDYVLHTDTHPQIWAYSRTLDDESALVVLNWSNQTIANLPGDAIPTGGTLRLDNYRDNPKPEEALRPYEARIYDT